MLQAVKNNDVDIISPFRMNAYQSLTKDWSLSSCLRTKIESLNQLIISSALMTICIKVFPGLLRNIFE